MDEDTPSARLGLTREEAGTVQEMKPDTMKMLQGEEEHWRKHSGDNTITFDS